LEGATNNAYLAVQTINFEPREFVHYLPESEHPAIDTAKLCRLSRARASRHGVSMSCTNTSQWLIATKRARQYATQVEHKTKHDESERGEQQACWALSLRPVFDRD
jgi:hypothetical protein